MFCSQTLSRRWEADLPSLGLQHLRELCTSAANTTSIGLDRGFRHRPGLTQESIFTATERLFHLNPQK